MNTQCLRAKHWMRRGGILLSIAVAVSPVALAFTRFQNQGCESEGYPVIYLAWPPTLQGGGAINGGMYINPNCDDPGCAGTTERDAIVRAMETWTAAPFAFTFVFSGDTTALPYDGTYPIDLTDEVSVSGWTDMDGPGALLAKAWIFFECWGEIVETDIQFDQGENWSTAETVPGDAFDVETVALHELGHTLGLDHGDPPAVMYGYISPGTAKRELTQDDIDGGVAIYGPPPSGVEDFEDFE